MNPIVKRAALATAIFGLAAGMAPAPAAAETEFSISVDTGPNHIRNITLKTFMERLEEESGGALVGELFESGQLYSSRDVPRAVARGDVDMAVPTTSALAAFESNLNALNLPIYAGLSPEEMNALVDGAFGERLAEGVENRLGLVVPGRWFLLGPVISFGAGTPITGFQDFEGARMRVPSGAAFIKRYEALGSEAVVIPFPDLPLALSQGTVDGVLSTSETIRSAKLHEAGITTALEDNIALLYYMPIVNADFWNGLSEEERTAFSTAWDSVIDEQRTEALRRQAGAKADNEALGIAYYTPSAEDLAAVRDKLESIVPALVEELDIDPSVVDLAREEMAAR